MTPEITASAWATCGFEYSGWDLVTSLTTVPVTVDRTATGYFKVSLIRKGLESVYTDPDRNIFRRCEEPIQENTHE